MYDSSSLVAILCESPEYSPSLEAKEKNKEVYFDRHRGENS